MSDTKPTGDEWPPADEEMMTLTLPVNVVRSLAALMRHTSVRDVNEAIGADHAIDPGYLADDLRDQVNDHYKSR
jgi:hypothetical protein